MHGMSFISIATLRIAGSIEFSDNTYLHTKNLTIQSGGKLGWFVEGEIQRHVIQIDQETVVENNSILSVNAGQFTTNQAYILGKLDLSFSSATIKKLSLAGGVDARESIVQVEETVCLQTNAEVKLQKSLLRTKELKNEGRLTIEDSRVSVDELLDSQNKWSSKGSLIEAKKVNISGKAEFNRNQINVAEKTIMHPSGGVDLIQSKLQTPLFRTEGHGEVNCLNVELQSSWIEANSRIKFSAAFIKTNTFAQANEASFETTQLIAETSFEQKSGGKLTS